MFLNSKQSSHCAIMRRGRLGVKEHTVFDCPQKEVTEANQSKLVRKSAELLHSLSVPLNLNIASKIYFVKTFPPSLTRTSLGESKKEEFQQSTIKLGANNVTYKGFFL